MASHEMSTESWNKWNTLNVSVTKGDVPNVECGSVTEVMIVSVDKGNPWTMSVLVSYGSPE